MFEKYRTSSNRSSRVLQDLIFLSKRLCELSLTRHIVSMKVLTFYSMVVEFLQGLSSKGKEKKIILSCDMKNRFWFISPDLFLGQEEIVLCMLCTILQIWEI